MSASAQRPARFPELPQAILAALAVQAVLLLVAAWNNRELLNPDAIAYLRIAQYYAEGRSDLMLSGYWGPLLSWLIAPLLFVCEPLTAARIVMAASGMLFSVGCLAIFRRIQLPTSAQIAGMWIAGAMSVFWSIRYITPDLLLSGFVSLAVAWMVDERWLKQTHFAVVAGGFWAVAYFAKAVAFPLALLVSIGIALLWWIARKPTKEVARALGITAFTFVCMCGPWIGALSLKYGGFTFSTSGKINHAIAGPSDVERYHPFARKLHTPPPGRLTAWEDPNPADYAYWSPFSNSEYARHQLGIAANNTIVMAKIFGGVDLLYLLRAGNELSARDVTQVLGGMDLCYLGLIGLVLSVPWRGGFREVLARERWRWAAVPVVCLAALYLPVFLLPGEQRYFYPAWPFLWIVASGATIGLVRQFPVRKEKLDWVAARLVAGSFGLPAVVWLLVALVGIPVPASIVARDLAARIEATKSSGPIAGSAQMAGGRVGLFVAFYLKQPWFGDDPEAPPEAFRDSGAQLIIVGRGEPLAEAMATIPGIVDLDPKLFQTSSEAENYPLKVFSVK